MTAFLPNDPVAHGFDHGKVPGVEDRSQGASGQRTSRGTIRWRENVMLKRVSALTMALALGVAMAGCQPAEEGGGGGMQEPDENMASPSPWGGGGGGMATPSPGMGGNERGTPPGPDEAPRGDSMP
jgi:hypothetical protein